MKKFLVPYVLVPAGILILVTIARAWFECRDPDAAVTKLLSANILSLIWVLCATAVMLKRGFSLAQGMLAGLLFFVIHRLAIGTVYAMAWADQWTVAGTEQPVRYVAQIREQFPDASVLVVFLANAFGPVLFGLVLLLIVWSVTWAIAFRSKRPFAAAA